MEALGVAASLGQLIELTLKTIKYLNGVKDASKDRIRLLREVPSLLSLLVGLKTNIDEEQPDMWSDGIQLLAVKDGPMDQLREALNQLTERLKAKKGFQGMARSMIWTLEKDYCADLLLKIERAKSTIGLALHGDTLYAGPDSQDETRADITSHSKLAQAIKADTAAIGHINQGVITVSESVERLHTQKNSKERQEILEWFSPLNVFQTQQDLYKMREDGTGQWLIDSTTFQDWLSGHHRTLCCTGIPGAGKTILASVIVDFLRKLRTKPKTTGVAAIYCTFEERPTQTPENLLASACVQLAQQSSGPLPEALVAVHESHDKLKTRPSCAEVLKIFDEVVHGFDTVYLVIDALDESSEQVRNILLKITKALLGNIVLLVTTRHVDNIVNRFHDCPKIEIRATDMDLTKYVSSRIAGKNRLECMVRDEPSLENEICERIIAKADGMFLAAKFHMDALSEKGTLKLLRKALENLPTTLDELYNEVLRRIEAQSQDNRQLAFKALRWVAYTYRPLTLRALQEALAIESGEEDFDCDGLPPIGLVIDVCAGLLTANVETGKVRLIHYTTQDYLDSILVSKFPDAHALIAGDCLTYLSYKVFQSDHREHDFRLVVCKYKLFEYASTFWATHARTMRTPELYAQIQRYLASDPQVYLIPIAGYDQSRRYRVRHWGRCPGYGIAAFFGLSDELRHSLQYVVDIDQVICTGDFHYRLEVQEAALHLAARNNQVEIVCILLDHGANIERKTLEGETPLFVATKYKALATAEVLIQRGANVMATSSQWGDLQLPFQVVWWSSPVQFLQHLLDAGTKLKRQHLFEESPLMRSIIDLDEPQTNQWLFCTALKDPDRTPLQSRMLDVAARKGANYMVDTLLNFGADVNYSNHWGNTALHRACSSGHLAIVERLLECGVNVNKRDYQGELALHQAVRLDQVEIVDSLIVHHLDINVRTGHGVTPLMMAIHHGCTSSALSLLQHGAITGLADVNGITALHLASARGNTSLVRGLMDQNESLEQKSNLNLAAFFSAEERSRERYVAPIALLDVKDYHGYRIAIFAVHGSKAFSKLREEDLFPGIEEHCLKWRVWEQGMTAFEIALLRDDKQTMDLLSLGEKKEDQSYRKTRDEYFREGFAASSFQELMTKFERRGSEEYGLQERRRLVRLL